MLPFPIPPIDKIQEIARSFSQELKDTYEGEKTSLPFLIHTLPRSPHIAEGSIIQVMVFGGTLFKTSIFQKKSEAFVLIHEEEEEKTPLFIDKKTFVDFTIQKLNEATDFLVINFAYPIQPILNDDALDGILLHGTKEHIFAGMVGSSIGNIVRNAAQEAARKSLFVSVANDAVCLLLSQATKQNWNEIVGGIIGTGTNYAITLPDQTIVNLECGNFHTFPLSESGKQIDVESSNPGTQRIEKEIAGAYLYKHYNYYVKRDSPCAPLITSSSHLSEIAANEAHPDCTLARSLLGRSARLAAAQMAGIYHFKTDLTDLTFVMEGNLFWQGWHYKEQVGQCLGELGLQSSIHFTKNEHHSIEGGLRLLKGLS